MLLFLLACMHYTGALLSRLSTKIELSIECKNLRDMDLGIADKSDPLVVVYLMRNGSWDEVGRTGFVVLFLISNRALYSLC